mmetsp:Transcript_10084/g.21573  ORF Transcript_10084/g.21573 Transcript_10084/m.21573 type:complete len:345 (+) Transcript_10084:73-1107(+)
MQNSSAEGTVDALLELANLKLDEGDAEGAQELFTKVAALRKLELEAEAKRASQQTVPEHTATPSRPVLPAAPPANSSSTAVQSCTAHQEEEDDDWERSWEKGLPPLGPGTSSSAGPSTAAAGGPASQPGRQQASSSRPGGIGSVPSGGLAAARADAGSTGGSTDSARAASRSASTSAANGSSTAGKEHKGSALLSKDHVLEVFGLTQEVRTEDVQEWLDLYWGEVGGTRLVCPAIFWVDDAHALLVCPTVSSAKALMALEQDVLQLRPFSEACPKSKEVPDEELLPPRERPKTTAAVARRMLSHALHMPGLRDKSAEQKLAAERRAARQQRADKEAAREAVWDE